VAVASLIAGVGQKNKTQPAPSRFSKLGAKKSPLIVPVDHDAGHQQLPLKVFFIDKRPKKFS
jgi:hypothetical protein